MMLPQKYAGAPDLPLMSGNGQGFGLVPITFIEQKLPWRPDLWLQIDAGWSMRNKPAHGKNVIVATDPHVLNYDAQRSFADTFYCMQTPYMQDGDEYLPYAYDPIWHAPEEQPRNFDVCLIGLHYAQRTALVEALRKRGLNVYYDLGPSFDEARALYNQAPIGLNWSSRQDLTARVFELLGMKRLAIVNRVPDEAIVMITHFAEKPDDAQYIAAQGHKTVQAHTWDARISTILEAV
jgi:hypothetical protein